ncbi:SDR family oxidoreductase [Sphingomonas sp. MMS24-JH45]
MATATALGPSTGLVHAAGVSPSMASADVILKVDLYGTAVLLEAFGAVIEPGGSGVVIASQSGHRLGALTAEEDAALATTPADELLALPMLRDRHQHAARLPALQAGQRAAREGRGAALGSSGARINAISPGIVITPLARHELGGPRADYYNRMIKGSPVGRAGTPDEVGAVGALLMGPDGAFITGSDFLMDGGVTASWFYGDLKPE